LNKWFPHIFQFSFVCFCFCDFVGLFWFPVTHFFFLSTKEGWFWVNFDSKITPPNWFSFYPNWISDFHIFLVFFRLFLWCRCLCTTLFVLISRLCTVCFWFSFLVWCLFDLSWKICFEQVQIRSMTLTSSTLQIRIHECCEFVHRFILFVFIEFEFVLYLYTLSIWMNAYRLLLSKNGTDRSTYLTLAVFFIFFWKIPLAVL